MFDRITREYDKRYGINSEHLNSIAEINFGNAKRNPNAQTRGRHPRLSHQYKIALVIGAGDYIGYAIAPNSLH